jgi:phosphoribosyl 1,2-cyclic phosphate phosphodiesterase
MSLRATLLGTGTSQGVPVIACQCAVCTSPDARDKRLRCSVLLELPGKTFCIDAGPDFRQQMLRADVRQLDAVLYTHLHKDHTGGLDDIRAFYFPTQQPMDVFLDANTLQLLQREYPYIFDGTSYPGIPKLAIHLIEGMAPFEVQGTQVQPIPVLHHKLPVNGFRIGSFAYVTDANYIGPESMALLQDLDVLVLNALQFEHHISHFTVNEALAVVEQLRPRATYLTHISHRLGRHSEVEAKLPPGVQLAYDGQVLEFD